MFDAWKDVTTGNSLRLPTGESSIDIVLNDSYTGGREIADMFLVFKNLKQQYGNYYEVNILKSTTDKPDDFASIYKYSAKTELEDAYTYVRLTDFKKAAANINMSQTNEINPYLLLMAHTVIKHVIDIDNNKSLGITSHTDMSYPQ